MKLALSLLVLLCIPARAQESNGDLQKEIESLKKRLEQLEKGSNQPHILSSKGSAEAHAAESPEKVPFAFADFTWLNGTDRTHSSPLETKYFTGEFRFDGNYTYSGNHPKDHTIDGSVEVSRANEFQIMELGVGGTFHYENVRGRFLTQLGQSSQTEPRNDPSPSRGQWNLGDGYKYISEAYAGYHWDKWYGVNLDAGIFMSYVGLFSEYQFDNWAYSPSYVSANTPFFFNGLRLQIFPTEKLKIEPWLINGWQSYGMLNENPGLGLQVLYRPTGSVSILSNNYWGHDTLGVASRQRIHTDNSLQVKYYDRPQAVLDKAAFSLTLDAGCEYGGGVSCAGSPGRAPAQSFLGFMLYNRTWFHRDLFGLTVGGGAIANPGRYLVLLPPINGATASTGSPYFTQNPGDRFKAWDCSVTFDYMPKDFVTWRLEFNHRAANVPYFAGPGGMTPVGGNTGAPGALVPGFKPDLRGTENRLTFALLVKI